MLEKRKRLAMLRKRNKLALNRRGVGKSFSSVTNDRFFPSVSRPSTVSHSFHSGNFPPPPQPTSSVPQGLSQAALPKPLMTLANTRNDGPVKQAQVNVDPTDVKYFQDAIENKLREIEEKLTELNDMRLNALQHLKQGDSNAVQSYLNEMVDMDRDILTIFEVTRDGLVYMTGDPNIQRQLKEKYEYVYARYKALINQIQAIVAQGGEDAPPPVSRDDP